MGISSSRWISGQAFTDSKLQEWVYAESSVSEVEIRKINQISCFFPEWRLWAFQVEGGGGLEEADIS